MDNDKRTLLNQRVFIVPKGTKIQIENIEPGKFYPFPNPSVIVVWGYVVAQPEWWEAM
jgi:hypothetical protein